jgi:hypothetical protein
MANQQDRPVQGGDGPRVTATSSPSDSVGFWTTETSYPLLAEDPVDAGPAGTIDETTVDEDDLDRLRAGCSRHGVLSFLEGASV